MKAALDTLLVLAVGECFILATVAFGLAAVQITQGVWLALRATKQDGGGK